MLLVFVGGVWARARSEGTPFATRCFSRRASHSSPVRCITIAASLVDWSRARTEAAPLTSSVLFSAYSTRACLLSPANTFYLRRACCPVRNPFRLRRTYCPARHPTFFAKQSENKVRTCEDSKYCPARCSTQSPTLFALLVASSVAFKPCLTLH